MNLLLTLLDVAVRPISPSVIIDEEILEHSVNYTPIVLICAAVIVIIGLTIFFIKKNKNNKDNKNDTEE